MVDFGRCSIGFGLSGFECGCEKAFSVKKSGERLKKQKELLHYRAELHLYFVGSNLVRRFVFLRKP